MKKLVLTAACAGFMVAPLLAQAADWGYAEQHRTAHWQDSACNEGKMQSPVNITEYAKAEMPPLELMYKSSPLMVMNSGHTVQAKYAPGSVLKVGGKSYGLLQFDFHTPSEHYISGTPYPMEMHLIHQAEDGELAIIAVMLKVGAQNPIIQGIWDNVPEDGLMRTVEDVEYNALGLLPESWSYYRYVGSLTMPPCAENVQWFVMKAPIEISEAQLKAFQNVYPLNARPVQPLNERTIFGN